MLTIMVSITDDHREAPHDQTSSRARRARGHRASAPRSRACPADGAARGRASLELGSAFMATHAVYAVARLGIADALASGPRSAEDVAADLGTDPDATFRLLRASAAYGIVRHVGDRFDLTRRRSHAPLRLAWTRCGRWC